MMDLRESKFYYAGQDMNFAVFSDTPCRVRYVESIPLPIVQTPVEVYTIEPAANSEWIVVDQRNDGKSSLKFFLRQGDEFREHRSHDLPQPVKQQILRRVPKSPWNSERSWAA
jgi:hypothetical protein